MEEDEFSEDTIRQLEQLVNLKEIQIELVDNLVVRGNVDNQLF